MANNEAPEHRTGNGGLAIRWIHLAVALSVYLVSVASVYATMRTQLDETRERVRVLEQEVIRDAQFQEFREDIQRRLQRIEDKLDRDRAIRELK